MEITRFTPSDSDAVDAWVRFVNARNAVDAPWEWETTPAQAVGLLTHGWDGDVGTPYLCVVGGELVATAHVWTHDRENLHLAEAEVIVHPEHRRHGYGTEVLAFVEAEARRLGRTTLAVPAWESDAMRAFGAAHGYREVHRAIRRRQLIAEVDRATLAQLVEVSAPYARDYAIERWPSPTPPADRDALAVMTAAINDAPTDDMDVEDEVFDAGRIQAYETATEGRGERMHRLVARHVPSGQLAGQTVVCVDRERPAHGYQHDTTVVREHRGHRLGVLLKAEMLTWLAADEPALEEIVTWNAESNDHMIGVNELLGYRVDGRELIFERKI